MLTIHDLSASYDGALALKEVNLRVKAGEILALIGPNGAGKSTLIRVVSGVLKPESGQILLEGTDIQSYSPMQRARRIAVVPQARQFGGTFTVEQTVMLGRTAYIGWFGKDSSGDREKVRWAMEQTNIYHLAERRLAEISGGEQQRVLLARALAQETPVLLLDEPTNHLDLGYQASLLKTLRSLVDEQQLAVLMAIHDLNQVSICADRVALLVDGVVRADGSLNSVITAENINTAYRADVEVIERPGSCAPLIVNKL